MTTPEHPETSFTVTVPGGRLTGRAGGRGAPLVLVHGGPGLSDYTAELLPETTGWSTARYTQRGVAPSEASGPYTVAQHVEDLLAVLDHLGWRQAVLLGHSWGAFLACAVAAVAPHRVAALLLVDGLGVVGDGGMASFGAELVARTPPADRARVEELIALDEQGAASDAEALEQLDLLWPGYFADPEAAPPMPADLRLSAAVNVATVTTVAADLHAGATARGLRTYPGPVEFLAGAASPMPVTSSSDTAALLPRAHVTTVPDAGHFPWVERPGCVHDALDRLRDVTG